jgi:hypothetical protein
MKAKRPDITRIFRERTLIDSALRIAARDALRQHKQAGNPVTVWRDGAMVWIAPEDIKLWEEP